MKTVIQLARIPDDQYSDYRYNVIFKAYKWDPQVGDQNTIAKHAVLMDLNTLSNWRLGLSIIGRDHADGRSVYSSASIG